MHKLAGSEQRGSGGETTHNDGERASHVARFDLMCWR